MDWNWSISFLPTAWYSSPVRIRWWKNIYPAYPGDLFIKQLDDPLTNKIRLAKEFVKFNERCFVRLLGDMRSYNFVVDITPDIEDYQYRIRAIDFDQQSYEGRKNLYLPQFFKENYSYVHLSMMHLNKESMATIPGRRKNTDHVSPRLFPLPDKRVARYYVR
ncbi:MAG: hypothetical protein WDO71_01720 [Bacteroidota bacterium]